MEGRGSGKHAGWKDRPCRDCASTSAHAVALYMERRILLVSPGEMDGWGRVVKVCG